VEQRPRRNLDRPVARGEGRLVVFPPTLRQRPPGLPCGTPKFNRVEWLGFVSLATSKTAFYIDNLRLSLTNN